MGLNKLFNLNRNSNQVIAENCIKLVKKEFEKYFKNSPNKTCYGIPITSFDFKNKNVELGSDIYVSYAKNVDEIYFEKIFERNPKEGYWYSGKNLEDISKILEILKKTGFKILWKKNEEYNDYILYLIIFKSHIKNGKINFK